MEIKEKMQICKVVAQAILSDGQVTDSESAFINDLMKKYELDADQQKEVLAVNIGDDPAKIVEGITSFSSQSDLMTELVMAVAADEVLTKTERQLIDTVADAIGVPQADMEMLVKNALM